MSKCVICGLPGSDMDAGSGTIYHAKCATCPECGNEGEVLWKMRPSVPPGGLAFKCLNCGHHAVYSGGRWQ